MFQNTNQFFLRQKKKTHEYQGAVARTFHDNGRVDIMLGAAADVKCRHLLDAMKRIHVELHALIVLKLQR